MSKVVGEVLAANREYAKRFGNKATLPIPPSGLLQEVSEATRIGKTA